MTIHEKSYLDVLQETTMINHVGSGPKDPAPKEKETKSATEDTTGPGTGQAGTCSPNKVPPVAAMKKLLAKEGIEIKGETLEEIKKEVLSLSTEQKDNILKSFAKMRSLKKEVKKRSLEKGLSPKAAKAQAGMVTRRAIMRQSSKKHGIDKKDLRSAQRFNVLNVRDLGLARSTAYKRKLAKEKIKEFKDELTQNGVEKKLLDDESFLPMLEAYFSYMGKERILELTKTRNLPTRVAKYMTDPAYRERSKDLMRLRKMSPAGASAFNYGNRKYDKKTKKRILQIQPRKGTLGETEKEEKSRKNMNAAIRRGQSNLAGSWEKARRFRSIEKKKRRRTG